MVPRKLLAFTLLALLALTAGCSAEGSLTMRPVDGTSGLAAQASNDLADDPQDRDAALVRRAIENGTATAADDHPPVDEELPVRHDGRFYAVNYTESGTESGYDAEIQVDYNASTVEGDVVEFGDLPAVDRHRLADALPDSEVDEARLEPGYDVGISSTYTDAEAESSVLVTDQEYDAVRYEGKSYPLNVRAESTTLTVYRYEATLVADSPESYGQQLRDDYEFELSGLSDAERSVVDAALNDTNYIEDSDNQGFASLVDRFRAQDPVVETDYYGNYVVRYDGGLYWAEMDYGSYVEDDDEPSSGAEERPPDETPPGA